MEARVSCGVVVAALSFDNVPSLVQVGEHVFIEAFVAQPSIERLDEGVLHR
jgi:hypothetical protein